MTLPSLASIQAAAELVHRVMLPSPQIRWPLLCACVGAEILSGGNVDTDVFAQTLAGN